jgi:hypothetical protein
MDLGTVAAAVLRPGVPGGVRDERVVLSLRLIGSLLDGRASLAEISPDFAHEVRAAPADAQATLILPAGPGPARIEIAGRSFMLPVPLRDALVAASNGAGAQRGAPPAVVPAGAQSSLAGAALPLATEAFVVAASTGSPLSHAAAATLLAASGALRAVRNDVARSSEQAVLFEAPLFDPRTSGATAARLAAEVSGSGAFFEAHVAQWTRGDRSTESVRGEAEQLAATLVDPARAEARTRVQLDALQRQAITLSGPAWSGQPLLLELGRDPQVLPDGASGAGADAERVYCARLKMTLPHLGTIEVRLRLAGESIGATIAADLRAREELERALPDFASALTARGLRPVLLQAVDAGEARQ